ncbi:hypothetical protein BN2497_11577 [Janthinobacterium sp. CG23_2]|nr:hypothetical protein BN2497_11577 [Janthinobacterium sp. CG23_2]CUU32186.1 hypothetical protein BN3177_11577 [Janthinobacterium sp. CG23_2]
MLKLQRALWVSGHVGHKARMPPSAVFAPSAHRRIVAVSLSMLEVYQGRLRPVTAYRVE